MSNDNIHPTQRWNALCHARMTTRAGITPEHMQSIHFGYIAPIEYLDFVPDESKFHLCLAHLCKDKRYCDFYKAKRERGDLIFMDNSCFELGEGIDSEQLLDLIDGSGINPHVIVAPDYPGQNGLKTLRALDKFLNTVDNRYKHDVGIMGVPQGEVGDHAQWMACYEEMVKVGIDAIGMSILALPNAFCHLTGTKDISHNRLYGSMYLKRKGLYNGNIWHHYLGASSPSEMQLIPQLGMADSMDSSSPIWHGINGIKYDDSPTGLKDGKIKKHVDFNLPVTFWHEMQHIRDTVKMNRSIAHNIKYVKRATQPQ